MDHQLDHASESRRLSEVDAAMRTLNLGMAGTVALAAVLFVQQFSVAFAAFASLPLLFWIVRLSSLGRLMSIRGWNIASLPVMITAIGAAALLSGGADSPVAFFVGVVALWGHAMFANLVRCTALGVGSLFLLAGVDLAIGRSIDAMTFVCALVIAGYLPSSSTGWFKWNDSIAAGPSSTNSLGASTGTRLNRVRLSSKNKAPARTRNSRSSCSTSITSKRSTIAMATHKATGCSLTSHMRRASTFVDSSSSTGSAAKSSLYCYPAQEWRSRRRWLNGSATGSRTHRWSMLE